MDSNKLLISEDFYSVQCEGITSGTPSYFIRLANCNLHCGASPAYVNQFREGRIQNPALLKDTLFDQDEASWICDTIATWAKGEEKEFQYIIDRWKQQGIYERILSGNIHIIFTGGEPTIPMHQKSIVNFIRFLQIYTLGDLTVFYNPFYEIETNGTIPFLQDVGLFKLINQINCSPKLRNSGMITKERIEPIVINQIKSHPRHQFKFVISTEDDIKEMFDTFIYPFKIPLSNVVCMPGLDKREDYHERTQFVLEMAKKYGFIGLTRLHISAWDKTTGV